MRGLLTNTVVINVCRVLSILDQTVKREEKIVTVPLCLHPSKAEDMSPSNPRAWMSLRQPAGGRSVCHIHRPRRWHLDADE
jgi:hypothetical protein